MDTKNRLIQKLLKVAKRHKFLTYPILALVALISVVSNLFSWGTGAGKRVVAVIMVMVLLVSQSYFLTSSATETIDDEETALVQAELQEEVKNEEASSDKNQGKNSSAETATEVADNSEAKNEKQTDDTASSDVIEEEDMNSDSVENQVAENMSIVDENYSIAGIGSDTGDGSVSVDADNDSYIDEEEIDSNLAPGDPKNITVCFWYPNDDSNKSFGDLTETVTSSGYNTSSALYTFNVSTLASGMLSTFKNGTTYNGNGCYTYDDHWYKDKTYSSYYTDEELASMTAKESDTELHLYGKRTLAKYRINILKNDNTEDPATFAFGEEAKDAGDTSCYVNITDGTATLTLNALSRHGYDVKVPAVSEGSASYDSSSNTVTLTFTGTTAEKTVTLGWTGKSYNITYAKTDKEGADTIVRSAKYGTDSDSEILSMSGNAVEPDGKNYKCWTVGLGVNAPEVQQGVLIRNLLYSETSSLQKYLFDHQDTILYPKYTYAGIVPSQTTVELHYLQEKNSSVLVQGKYNKTTANPGHSNFSYEIISGNVNLIQEDYGITVSCENDGILFSTGAEGPTKTTGNTPLVIKFKVYDNNGTPNDDSDDEESETFSINLTIAQRTVTINPITDKSNIKPYDGNDIAKLNSTTLTTDTDKVTITYTSAKYNSANVSEATTINLAGAKIVVEGDDAAGTKAGNYILSSASVAGTITKRPVWVKTSAELNSSNASLGYVRAGEADPSFKVEEDTSKSGVFYGILDDEDIDDLNITLTSDRPSDKTVPGTYKVIGNAGESNYEVNYTEPLGTFDVVMESPAGKYNFSDGLSGDVWHTENKDGAVYVRPNSNSGYSKVYIYRKGSSTPDTDGAIREEDTFDEELKIQLVDPVDETSGTGTGAVTSKEKFVVKYQYTSPQFVSYKILDIEDVEYNSDGKIKTGLYFPEIGSVLDFGTYIKSTIKIQIEYKDNTSKMDELYYTLFNSGVEEKPVNFDDDGKAIITVYREAVTNRGKNPDTTASIIECRGVNKAGISSGSTVLCPTYDNNRDYEWSIESGAPQVNPLIVYADTDKATRRIVADQSGVADDKMSYYNHCEASLSVSDAVSGIESITWYINGEKYDKEDVHKNTKVTADTYTTEITGLSTDICKIYAVVADNAGNEVTTNTVAFRMDDVDPNVDSTYDDSTWTKNTRISFTASDDLSGVDYIKVSDETGKTIDCDIQKPNTITGEYLASFEATNKGKYSIVVADNAGNIKTKELNVQKISTTVPPCPTITITPEEPNGPDGWYNAAGTTPVATIINPQKASDDTPVTTQYRLWKEGETGYNDTPVSGASIDVPINDEGVFNVKAWTKSVSGVECDNYNGHVKVVKVDKTAPDISISTEKGSGTTVIVNFTVTDNVSGVDFETVEVEHGGKLVDITKEETSEGVEGSFEISETGNYTIKATDIAGNESDEAAFTPMSLKVKAVTNITDTGATVAANVTKGTFDIKSASIAYRKYVDEKYTEAEAVLTIDPSTGNAAVSAALSELDPGTAYVYKVTATSDINEVLEYEGYFKTLATDQSGIAVFGTARYADDSSGDITVGLFDGNVCMMAEEIEAGNEFTFVNVPDGNYNVVATDGKYSKTIRLLIEDGMISYPTEYIDLVLSGMNTSVVITTDSTPGVTVDDMDTIFDDDVAFTTKRDPSTPDKMSDKELVESGTGTVEFKLYATLMTVSAVSADEISAMYAVTDNNKVVGAYLDLSLYKIVTDVDGDVDKSRVTNLQSPAHISVTIPLGDLAGKPDLEVVRIHNDGENFIGASLADQDSNPSTYTITTDQFSTYAVLYSIGEATTEATEATEQPTTATTTTNINVQPVTPTNTNTNQSVAQSTTGTTSTVVYDDDDDDEDVKEIKDATKKAKASGTTSVGSLTSSGSAKTGDETPIAIMFGFMMISICGVVVLRRKSKEAD